MHADPTGSWTVAELAREAGLSRSTSFERFRREVGTAPLDFLPTLRMAMARDLLRRRGAGVGEIAGRVGYASASRFSAAFARHTGTLPGLYARTQTT